jgi:hypothetical protein
LLLKALLIVLVHGSKACSEEEEIKLFLFFFYIYTSSCIFWSFIEFILQARLEVTFSLFQDWWRWEGSGNGLWSRFNLDSLGNTLLVRVLLWNLLLDPTVMLDRFNLWLVEVWRFCFRLLDLTRMLVMIWGCSCHVIVLWNLAYQIWRMLWSLLITFGNFRSLRACKRVNFFCDLCLHGFRKILRFLSRDLIYRDWWSWA